MPDLDTKNYLERPEVLKLIRTAFQKTNSLYNRVFFVLQKAIPDDNEYYNAPMLAKKEAPFISQFLEEASVNSDFVESASHAYRVLSEYGSPFIITEKYSNIAVRLTELLRQRFPIADGRCIFISGPAQSGKSHLLVSLGRALLEREPKRSVQYRKFDLLAKRSAEMKKHGKAGEYLSFKRPFAVSNLLLDDISNCRDKKDTSGVFEIARNVLYAGGRVVATFRDQESLTFFEKEVSVFLPNYKPLIVQLPVPPGDHCSAVIKSKLLFTDMVINEFLFRYMEGLASIGYIPHSFQLADMFARVQSNPVHLGGQLYLEWDRICVMDPREESE